MAVPEIYISLAPPSEENLTEPFSPFDGVHIVTQEDADDFRPALLSPPPSMAMTPKHLSPLSPPEAPVKGQGLERERFEQLLKTSRERSAALGNKRSPDLRKELAVKTYKTKQCAFAVSSSLVVRHVDRLNSGTPCALLAQSGGTTLPNRRLRTQDAPRFAGDFQLLPPLARSHLSLGDVRTFGGGMCHLETVDRTGRISAPQICYTVETEPSRCFLQEW